MNPQFENDYFEAQLPLPNKYDKRLTLSKAKKTFSKLDVNSILSFAKFSKCTNKILDNSSAATLIRVCLLYSYKVTFCLIILFDQVKITFSSEIINFIILIIFLKHLFINCLLGFKFPINKTFSVQYLLKSKV